MLSHDNKLQNNVCIGTTSTVYFICNKSGSIPENTRSNRRQRSMNQKGNNSELK